MGASVGNVRSIHVRREGEHLASEEFLLETGLGRGSEQGEWPKWVTFVKLLM